MKHYSGQIDDGAFLESVVSELAAFFASDGCCFHDLADAGVHDVHADGFVVAGAE